MAKASLSLPTDAVHHNPAITAAAAAIHALVNSKAQSPTVGELAEVLAAHKALAAPAARETYLASAWCRALDEYLDASSRAKSDEEYYALDARLHDVAKVIRANRVRTPDDLIVRAAIAAHFYPHFCADELSDFQWTTEDALAAVVRGGLELAGLKFDHDGRLL